jgi:hypothetical protein
MKVDSKAALRIAALCLALLALGLAAPAAGEIIQRGGVRVKLEGEISPRTIPRDGVAPVQVKVGATISPTDGKETPPRLTRMAIAINSEGRLDATGLPVCRIEDIQPATNQKALAACRGALVGRGEFAAEVSLSNQGTYPSHGRILAFNGRYKGRPAIFAHVYGTEPVPTSVTLPFIVGHTGGTFGTTLTAALPEAENSYVTALSLVLSRRYTDHGKLRSYASAGCPAPKGFSGAVFPFAKVSFSFAGGSVLSSTLPGSCKVRG